MKITIITPALVAVLGLALAGAPMTSKAQSTNAAPAAAPAPAKAKSAFTPYKGKISAIDASSVTVTTKKGDLKLTLDATTKYAISKKEAKATDFAVGDDVTGSYATNADGTFTAHSLHKKAAK